MNALEKTMVETLKELKADHFVIGVKAEFEAEGTRMEEALRLKDVVSAAGLDLTIKIGGCEALKDMYDCRSIGVTRIVAPMIESSYALKKYLQATHMAYPEDEWKGIGFAINVETNNTVERLDDILANPKVNELESFVIGRVDMSGSMGLTREDINSQKVFEITRDVCRRAKKHGIRCGIGGGVSASSMEFFRNLDGMLDFYETRKVIFDAHRALNAKPEDGILKAVGFELMWLKNKNKYYGMIHHEDDTRIQMLETRYSKMIEEAGGKH